MSPEPNPNPPPAPPSQPAARRRRLVPALIGGLVLILIALPIVSGWPNGETLKAWLSWFEGPWGPFVYVVAYIAATILMVPASALTIAAGGIYGLAMGTILTSLASNLGAALAFLIARYFARDAVMRRFGNDPRFVAMDRAIADRGWLIVGLIRLSPAFPFNVQNYLYGLTGIRFWTCVLVSWAAMLPGTFLYVYLGHIGRAGIEDAAGSGARQRTIGEWALLIAGLGATVIVSVYLARLARQALQPQPQSESQPAES